MVFNELYRLISVDDSLVLQLRLSLSLLKLILKILKLQFKACHTVFYFSLKNEMSRHI